MKPILEFALEIATEYHKGQKRRDGKDYITHPIEVVSILESRYMTPNALANEIILIAGYAHDLAEDTSLTEDRFLRRFTDLGYFADFSEQFFLLESILRMLHKGRFDSYTDYITNLVKKDGDIQAKALAKRVKLADLAHNLSDLKPGSQRDKYELAKYILEKSL